MPSIAHPKRALFARLHMANTKRYNDKCKEFPGWESHKQYFLHAKKWTEFLTFLEYEVFPYKKSKDALGWSRSYASWISQKGWKRYLFWFMFKAWEVPVMRLSYKWRNRHAQQK